MLITLDRSAGRYEVAVNNASGGPEVLADLSLLGGAPAGTLVFDFCHLAAPLTQEKREGYLPGSFGHQPTAQLLEVLSVIAWYSAASPRPHRLIARLPAQSSRAGRFLAGLRLPGLLEQLGLTVAFAPPPGLELGQDDDSRHHLIPLTIIRVSGGRPDARALQQIRDRVEAVFARALVGEEGLARRLSGIVREAVDQLACYGRGGMIGGLYYRRSGEVEVTLANCRAGLGGQTPAEQLEALLGACERGSNAVGELSRLTLACFGSLLLRNGNAALRFLPDGSVVSTTEETGLPLPGAAATLVLQLLPDKSLQRTAEMKAFEEVLACSLRAYQSPLGHPGA